MVAHIPSDVTFPTKKSVPFNFKARNLTYR